MNKITLIFPAIILILMVIIMIRGRAKKNKNIPLVGIEKIFSSLCSISCQIIPEEVTDVFEFATGEWTIKNSDKVNFKEVLDANNILQYISIEFPSAEHEEFKNKLMIYGDYVSKYKFGPNAYVFSKIPELYFDSSTCATIYDFLKSHIQKN